MMKMNSVLHPTSIGGLTKKIMAINPDLSVQEIVWLIRQATRTRAEADNDYARSEVVDEEYALELTRASLNHRKANT